MAATAAAAASGPPRARGRPRASPSSSSSSRDHGHGSTTTWRHRRRPAVLANLVQPARFLFLFLLLLLSQLTYAAAAVSGAGGAADPPSSSSCALRLTDKVKDRTARPGKGVTIKIKLANRGGGAHMAGSKTTFANGTLELRLPLYTTYEGGVAKPNSARLARVDGGGGGNKRAQPVPGSNARTWAWTGLTLRPKGAITFVAKVRLQDCYPGPSLGFAYAASFPNASASSCTQEQLEGVAYVEVSNQNKRRFGRGRPVPGCGPTPAPTLRPTPAPTRSCGPGEYRPPAGGPCAFCPVGTFWNETYETTSCLGCPANQTSLQGAARCYTPCPLNSALNTTDLTCVPVPPSVTEVAAANNITIDFNTTQVFVVEEPDKLESTVGAAAAAGAGQAVVIVLAPGLYPQTDAYVLSANLVIIADPSLTFGGGGGGRRRRRRRRRQLQLPTAEWQPLALEEEEEGVHRDRDRDRNLQSVVVKPVIYATQNNRHYIMDNATIWTDGVLLLGHPTGLYSGGVELRNGAFGLFINTTFNSCRTEGDGGGLQLAGGSSCSIGAGSGFANNAAGARGGAIHAAPGCTVRVNNTVAFTNNSAPRTSPTAGGGGAIYLAGGAALVLDSDVTFFGNVDNDVTVAGGTVSCANPLYATNCTNGCTGAYDIPASCPVCSAGSGGVCTSCPQGSFGGANVALVCELCAYGYTTIYPPSSTSSADCVPITQSPTFAPTAIGVTVSPTLVPSQQPTSPTQTPSQQPSAGPTQAPSASPSQTPTTQPTSTPTTSPSTPPTSAPTASPSTPPTTNPTQAPSQQPSASPTASGPQRAPVVAKYLHDSCITVPTAPSPPSFTGGALLTAGSGGTYATLSAAIAAASAGDRIQVLPGTIVEAALVTVDKSLEIFGTGPTCVVQRDSLTAVLSIATGVNDVYIHDLGVTNNQLASGDGAGGLSSCITAATMQEASPTGSTGIYIASCTFTYPKMGVSIDAASWVVKDCVFTPNSNTPGATIRALAPYGSRYQSFATGNTFNNPTESGRLIAVALNAAGPRGAYFTTGWVGNFTLATNTIAASGGNPRAYIDTTGMYRQPGFLNTTGNNGEFSFYLQGNAFGTNYTSSPALFFVGSATVPAFGFFNVLFVKDNVFGARTAGGAQKGALFFSSTVAGTVGTFAGGFYAGGNSFSTANVPLNAAYAQASFTPPNLLVLETAYFATPAPLVTPIAPGATAGLPVVDNVPLAASDRVFAQDTCDAVRSGLYSAAAGAWARTADFAVGMDVAGAYFLVVNGTQFGTTSWNCTNAPGAATVGTDPLSFAQI